MEVTWSRISSEHQIFIDIQCRRAAGVGINPPSGLGEYKYYFASALFVDFIENRSDRSEPKLVMVLWESSETKRIP